jgi:Rod binding domain-containing protein
MSALNAITPSIDQTSARIIANNSAAPAQTSNEDKLKKAAQGFERTLIRQMLSTVRSTNIRGSEELSSASKSYLEIMDDHMADMLSKGKGMGFGTKMAEQLIQQANAGKLIGNSEIAVKDINAIRETPISADTFKSLQRPDGFLGAPQ